MTNQKKVIEIFYFNKKIKRIIQEKKMSKSKKK